jgi:Uma2 family endonuclease
MQRGDRGPAGILTPDEFLTHPASARASELVRGEVRVMTPAGGAHGVVAAAVFRALDRFVEDNQLGMCFSDNTGFALPGLDNTVRSPDAAFVKADRLPIDGIGSGWIAVAPNLIVEIISPSETPTALEEKLRDYRTAGTELMWVIDPVLRTVVVHSSSGAARTLSSNDTLSGESVLPGFNLPVLKLFERLAR